MTVVRDEVLIDARTFVRSRSTAWPPLPLQLEPNQVIKLTYVKIGSRAEPSSIYNMELLRNCKVHKDKSTTTWGFCCGQNAKYQWLTAIVLINESCKALGANRNKDKREGMTLSGLGMCSTRSDSTRGILAITVLSVVA